MATFWKKKTGKRSSKVNAKKRCLALWSKIVREKYPVCQYCGKRESAQAHHVITRQTAVKPFWFDPDYGIGLCHHCHSTKAHSTDIDDAIEFRDWVASWLDADGLNYEKMKFRARTPGRGVNEIGLLAIEAELKEQWNAIK